MILIIAQLLVALLDITIFATLFHYTQNVPPAVLLVLAVLSSLYLLMVVRSTMRTYARLKLLAKH